MANLMLVIANGALVVVGLLSYGQQRTSNHQQLRAYVTFDRVQTNPIAGPDGRVFAYDISGWWSNHGQTPAHGSNVGIDANYKAPSAPVTFQPCYKLAINKFQLGPGNNLHTYPKRIPVEKLEEVESGKVRLYMLTDVKYRDIFEESQSDTVVMEVLVLGQNAQSGRYEISATTVPDFRIEGPPKCAP